MAKLFLKEKHLDILKTIFNDICPNSIVYAYGSRIKGLAHNGSDLDLAIVLGEGDANISELIESVKNSNLPFLVDIFELKSLPDNFQNDIMKNNVVIFGKM